GALPADADPTTSTPVHDRSPYSRAIVADTDARGARATTGGGAQRGVQDAPAKDRPPAPILQFIARRSEEFCEPPAFPRSARGWISPAPPGRASRPCVSSRRALLG